MVQDIKHIMFDNDGVNIDSEDAAMRVMDDWGTQMVLKYKPHADLQPDYIYRTYPGTSTDRIVAALINEFNLPEDKIREDYSIPADKDVSVVIADLITIDTIEHFRKNLKAIPGVTEALTQIRASFGGDNMCLATTSRADRMDVSLDHAVDPVTGENAKLGELFPKGELRRSGYGHPNKYVEAFEATGFNPAQTVVVEDSLSGVTKAKDANADVRVIGTVAAKFYEDKPAQAKKLIDAGANFVISDMSDLPYAIEWLRTGLTVTYKPNFKSPVYMKSDFANIEAVLTSEGPQPAGM